LAIRILLATHKTGPRSSKYR